VTTAIASRTVRFWVVTFAAILGVGVTLSLARWQLSRAAQKEALHAAIETQGRAAPLDSRSLAGVPDLAPLVHRPVRLRGTWAAEHTVYLDNRQMHARPGFYVVTPLRLEGGGAVLVQRGWIARDFLDRARLAPVETPSGSVEITGRIAPSPAHLFELGSKDPKAQAAEGSSRIRQNLDLAAFRAETGLPLAEGSIVQLGAASEGLQREWPEVATGVEKHYGYAFQWFGLSALIFVLYVWFQLIAPRRRRSA
jgi:cytochrome oxidase assembly protein ShyY1